MLRQFNRRVMYTLFSIVVVAGGTFGAILYAKGNYRITRQGFAPSTGLLSANSFPNGAEILIDGKLISATDNTLYLEPGTYNVQIQKDGYSPWSKKLNVQKELVTQTNALLFPIAPSLSPLTFTGVNWIQPSPDGQKLIYYTSTASAPSRNGLYLLELTNSPLSLQRGPKQISNDPSTFDLQSANLIWSPDSNDVLLTNNGHQIMLNLDKLSQLESLPDVSFSSKQTLSQWENEMYLRERQYLKTFPPEIIKIATSSAKDAYFSPDKKKLIYTATTSAQLADNLIPPVPAASNQTQERTLIPGSIYVYDREEDTNFKVGTEQDILNGKTDDILENAKAFTKAVAPSPSARATPLKTTKNLPTALTATASAGIDKLLLANDLFNSQAKSLTASPSAFTTLQASDSAKTAVMFNIYHSPLYGNTFQWLPDSSHLLYLHDNQIQIKEYDNANDTTVYAGPHSSNFIYPWPDGSKLLILTSFGSDTPNNLYGIELK